jgi:hypothetical protein
MKLTVKKPFDWAHQGVQITSYAKGDVIDTEDQDLIDVSRKEGWTSAPRSGSDKADADTPPDAQQPELSDTADTDASAA